MSHRYFFLRRGTRVTGPFPAARMLELRRSGAIDDSDGVSCDKIHFTPACELQWLALPRRAELRTAAELLADAEVPAIELVPQDPHTKKFRPGAATATAGTETAGTAYTETLMILFDTGRAMRNLREQPFTAAATACVYAMAALTVTGWIFADCYSRSGWIHPVFFLLMPPLWFGILFGLHQAAQPSVRDSLLGAAAWLMAGGTTFGGLFAVGHGLTGGGTVRAVAAAAAACAIAAAGIWNGLKISRMTAAFTGARSVWTGAPLMLAATGTGLGIYFANIC